MSGSRYCISAIAAFALVDIGIVGVALLLAAIGAFELGEFDPLLRPRAALFAAGLLLIALMFASFRMSFLPGLATVGIGFVLAFNLLFAVTASRDIYDTTPLAKRIAQNEGRGIAYYGGYHAEFNFTGRLLLPVQQLLTEQDLDVWIRGNPDGVVVARLDRKHPDWPQQEEILFRYNPYAIWSVANQRVSKLAR